MSCLLLRVCLCVCNQHLTGFTFCNRLVLLGLSGRQLLRMFFSTYERWSSCFETKRYRVNMSAQSSMFTQSTDVRLLSAITAEGEIYWQKRLSAIEYWDTHKEEESNLIQNRHTVQVKLADQQADPNSPLYSVKSFEELGLYVQTITGREEESLLMVIWYRKPELLKGLYAMKFSKPSKIQEHALPLLLANPYVIAPSIARREFVCLLDR